MPSIVSFLQTPGLLLQILPPGACFGNILARPPRPARNLRRKYSGNNLIHPAPTPLNTCVCFVCSYDRSPGLGSQHFLECILVQITCMVVQPCVFEIAPLHNISHAAETVCRTLPGENFKQSFILYLKVAINPNQVPCMQKFSPPCVIDGSNVPPLRTVSPDWFFCLNIK